MNDRRKRTRQTLFRFMSDIEQQEHISYNRLDDEVFSNMKRMFWLVAAISLVVVVML